MIEAHESFGGTVIGGDIYSGTRATGRIADAFVRRALVLDFYLGALAIETLVQTGFDSSALGTGVGVASSGGYAQLRLQLPHGMMAMTRYDGVSQSRADSRCSSRSHSNELADHAHAQRATRIWHRQYAHRIRRVLADRRRELSSSELASRRAARVRRLPGNRVGVGRHRCHPRSVPLRARRAGGRRSECS